ncbi:hypothetical protein HYX02_05265 [Candidatus Woesearchaeota archaeon]|nr:hypothetical protein [Candidatus Woesearchaeota archaeon]
MIDIFVYDGYPFRLQYQDRSSVETSLQKKLDEALKTLVAKMPDYLLLRTVPDFGGESKLFHGIDNLLINCATNGNDRSDQSVLDGNIDPNGKIAKAGYQGKDVMWANPALRDDVIKPYTWSGAPNGISLAVLIVDGRAYSELSYTVYGQKDVSQRRESLLGIVLFDMSPNEVSRPDLHLQLTPETIKPITKQIKQANYFLD